MRKLLFLDRMAWTKFRVLETRIQNSQGRQITAGDALHVIYELRKTLAKMGFKTRAYYGKANGHNHWWLVYSGQIIDPLGQRLWEQGALCQAIVYDGIDQDDVLDKNGGPYEFS